MLVGSLSVLGYNATASSNATHANPWRGGGYEGLDSEGIESLNRDG